MLPMCFAIFIFIVFFELWSFFFLSLAILELTIYTRLALKFGVQGDPPAFASNLLLLKVCATSGLIFIFLILLGEFVFTLVIEFHKTFHG